MVTGSLLYADEDAHHAFSGTYNDRDDDLNWLFPKYISSLKTLICPSTLNSVQDIRGPVPNPYPQGDENYSGIIYPERLHENTLILSDLQQVSPGGRLGKNNGASYEVAGYLNGGSATGTSPNYIRKTESALAGYSYQMQNTVYPEYNFKGQRASLSDIWILYDSDDYGDDTRKENNYPEAGDNHGDAGENVAFCDGHVEWVGKKKYLRSLFRGTDEAKPYRIPGT